MCKTMLNLPLCDLGNKRKNESSLMADESQRVKFLRISIGRPPWQPRPAGATEQSTKNCGDNSKLPDILWSICH
uniref:Uncharacterized protein n=1 Tax=Romanomermis culicivorax TaxID=13658 RepID=A0A915JGM3_ROMCU